MSTTALKPHLCGCGFCRTFKQGQFIDSTVEITAEHKGYMEFRLCPWNNVNVPITQKCLNKYVNIFVIILYRKTCVRSNNLLVLIVNNLLTNIENMLFQKNVF